MSVRVKKEEEIISRLPNLSLAQQWKTGDRRTATPPAVHLSRAEEEEAEAEAEEDIASRVTRAMAMAMAMMRSVDFVARG